MSNKVFMATPQAKRMKRSTIRVKTVNEEPSMTRQAHIAECDINNIMAKYQKDGIITHFAKHGENYSDLSGLDYTTAMQQVAKARSMFEELPSSARTKFNNDPGQFLTWIQDPANIEEARKLGLAKGVPENPPPSQVLNPTTPPISESTTPPQPAPAPAPEPTAAQ